MTRFPFKAAMIVHNLPECISYIQILCVLWWLRWCHIVLMCSLYFLHSECGSLYPRSCDGSADTCCIFCIQSISHSVPEVATGVLRQPILKLNVALAAKVVDTLLTAYMDAKTGKPWKSNIKNTDSQKEVHRPCACLCT